MAQLCGCEQIGPGVVVRLSASSSLWASMDYSGVDSLAKRSGRDISRKVTHYTVVLVSERSLDLRVSLGACSEEAD